MKINKLFHWLYAFLMFLPLVVFLPTGLYYAFNEHAVVNTEQTEIIEYKTLHFNQLIDLDNLNYNGDGTYEITNTGYKFNLNAYEYAFGIIALPNDFTYTSDDIYVFKYDFYHVLNGWIDAASIIVNNNIHEIYYDEMDNTYTSSHISTFYVQPPYTTSSNNARIVFEFGSDDDNQIVYLENLQLFNLTYMYGSGNEPTLNEFLNDFNEDYYDYTINTNITVEIPTGIYKEYTDITSNIAHAWDNVWQLPFFSWAGSSFLAQPFNYITVLFGIPNNSVFVYALSYWLSISIIWLVFDIVIYVPMLIHRWLDKASLS